MPTLILSPLYTEDSRTVRSEALAAGWHVYRLATRRLPEGVAQPDLVFYGEPGVVDAVAWAAGIALLRPTVDWLTTLPAAYRKRAVRLSTLAEARALTSTAFTKPALEQKSFPAGLYHAGEALARATLGLPDGLPVLVAEPVVWDVEYRVVVLERRPVASSPYLRSGVPARAADGSWPAPADEANQAAHYLTDLLDDPAVALPAAVVVDVGHIAGRGWAIVEANAVWAAGLYGCDVGAVLPALARAAIPRASIPTADRPWATPPTR